MKSDRVIEIIAAVVIAVILIGEVIVYTTDQGRYSSGAVLEDGTVTYTMSSGGSESYNVIISESSLDTMTEIYVYYDETYVSDYEEVSVPVGARALDQEYYIEQLVKQLDYRTSVEITVLDASGLDAAMAADIASGDTSKGLIVISGALPDLIYTGNSADDIFQWMNVGGRLYWLGNMIGCQYATVEELVPVDNYQILFFGVECLNDGDSEKAYDAVGSNDLRTDMSLSNNSVKYAVDVAALTAYKGADKVLDAGYSDGTYSSIVMTDYGNGMICIISGDYSNDQRADLSQMVASQLAYDSEILYEDSGNVNRTTVTKTADIGETAGNVSVYLYYGGYYTVYGEYYSLV